MKVWLFTLSISIPHVDLHTGREVGDRASLVEIQKAKEDDPLYHELSKEEAKGAIYTLLTYLEGKNSNARVTNKGAARDVLVTIEKIEKEVRLLTKDAFSLIKITIQLQSLHSRTGIEFFGMVTRSSVDDMIEPSWFGSAGATVFFADSFKINTWDLLRQFEQVCCSRKFGELICIPV
jgi:hypothetical protein